MSRRAFHLMILTLSLFTFSYAQPELDISFNGTGLVTSDFGPGAVYMAKAVVQRITRSSGSSIEERRGASKYPVLFK